MNCWQVIFQSRNGANGAWQDYCREPSPHPTDFNQTQRWALDQCAMLERRHKDCPFRAKYEFWN